MMQISNCHEFLDFLLKHDLVTGYAPYQDLEKLIIIIAQGCKCIRENTRRACQKKYKEIVTSLPQEEIKKILDKSEVDQIIFKYKDGTLRSINR